MDPSDPLSPLIPPNQHPVYLILILITVALLTYTQTLPNPQTPLHAITTSIFRTTAIRLIPLPTAILLLLSLLNAPLHTATLIPLVAFLASLVHASAPSETRLYNLALRFATPLPRVQLPSAALPSLINHVSADSIKLFHGSRIPFFTALAVHHTNPPVLPRRNTKRPPSATISFLIAARTHEPDPHPRFGFLSHRSPNPGAEAVLSLKACLRLQYLSRPSDNVAQMWEWAHATGFASLKQSHLPDIAVELARGERADAGAVKSRAAALGGFGLEYDTPTKIVLRLAVEANLVAVLGLGLLRGTIDIEDGLRRLQEGVLHALVDTGGFCASRGGRRMVGVPFREWPADRIADVVVEWLCLSCGMPALGSTDEDAHFRSC